MDTMKTEYKFTAGPWKTEGNIVIDKNRNVIAIRKSWTVMAKNGEILEAQPGNPKHSISPNEADSNAALLAAAPDMLEALQGVLDAIPNIPRHKGEQWDDELRLCYDSIRAAIHKATGGNTP